MAQLQSVAFLRVCLCVCESDKARIIARITAENKQKSPDFHFVLLFWLILCNMTGLRTATLQLVPCVVAEAHSLLARDCRGVASQLVSA